MREGGGNEDKYKRARSSGREMTRLKEGEGEEGEKEGERGGEESGGRKEEGERDGRQ